MQTGEGIAAVRRFTRYYTRQIGILGRRFLRSPFSLTQVRVLYELAHREGPTAGEIQRELGIDRGYLSRIVQGLARSGLIARSRAKGDQRRALLSLTPKGRKAFAQLDQRQNQEVGELLSKVAEVDRERLIRAMDTVHALLARSSRPGDSVVLRAHRPGDIGWVIHRHGVLYYQEYGWDERFEALVAEIAAKFIQNFDARRERCWIAEMDGAIAGSVFLVKQSAETAKLRLLLVEPWARGHGLGKRLVEECIRFARQAGYRKMVLWTDSQLDAARHIYEKAGFRLVSEERHNQFGNNQLGQEWGLEL